MPAAAPKLTKRERRAAVFTAERTVASESAFEDEDLSVYEAQGIMEDTLPGTGNIRRPELPVVPSPFEDEDDVEQLPVVPPPAPKAKKAKKVKVLVPEVAAVVSAFPDEPEVPFDGENFYFVDAHADPALQSRNHSPAGLIFHYRCPSTVRCMNSSLRSRPRSRSGR